MTEDVKHPFLSGMFFERQRVKGLIAGLLDGIEGDMTQGQRQHREDWDLGFCAGLREVQSLIEASDPPKGHEDDRHI